MAETTEQQTLEPEEVVVVEDTSDDDKDREYLVNYIKESEERIAFKEAQRLSNVNCVRPVDSHFSKLDSSLKKNTTFVKKLKNFSASQLDAFIKVLEIFIH